MYPLNYTKIWVSQLEHVHTFGSSEITVPVISQYDIESEHNCQIMKTAVSLKNGHVCNITIDGVCDVHVLT